MTLAITKSRSPAWPERRPALAAVACLLALLAGGAVVIDLPLARWFAQHPPRGDFARLVRLSEVFAWGGSVLLISVLTALLDVRSWRIGLLLACAALGSGLVADSLKLLVARTRPLATSPSTTAAAETFGAWLPALRSGRKPDSGGSAAAYGHAQQSFPSAHAATAAGLAVALAHLYPRGAWMFALFASLACFQRLTAGAHYASDVLAGAAVGCLASGLITPWGVRGLQSPATASNQGKGELK